MSSTHLHGHFYRCDDCSEEYDGKHNEHTCESREDLLNTLDAVRTIIGMWREADAHGLTGDPENYLRQIEEAVRT